MAGVEVEIGQYRAGQRNALREREGVEADGDLDLDIGERAPGQRVEEAKPVVDDIGQAQSAIAVVVLEIALDADADPARDGRLDHDRAHARTGVDLGVGDGDRLEARRVVARRVLVLVDWAGTGLRREIQAVRKFLEHTTGAREPRGVIADRQVGVGGRGAPHEEANRAQ
jgi:hypothetical protein